MIVTLPPTAAPDGPAADPALLRLMVEQMPCVAWTTDTTPAFASTQGAALTQLGLQPGELNGVALADVFPPDHPIHGAHRRALAGESMRYDAGHLGRSFECRVEPLRDASGRIVGCVGIALDVTERKAAERRLAEHALLLANVQDSVIVTDLDGTVTHWNAGAERLFGWSAAEMVGRPLTDRFPEPVRPWIAEQIRLRGDGVDWDGEFEDYRKDGSRVWIDARVRRLTDDGGRVIGVIGISHDISARKRAEAELRASEERYRRLFESDLIGVLTWEAAGGVTAANDEYLRIVGYTRADLEAGRVRWRDLTPPEYHHLDDAAIAAMRAGDRCTPFEKEYVREDGTRVPVLVGGTLLGGPDRGVAFVLDMTARRRAERQLQLLLDSTAEGVYGVDVAGRCTFVNRAATAMLGRPPEEILGRTLHDLIHHHRPDGSPFPPDQCPIAQTFRHGRGVRVADEVYWRADGSSFPVVYSSFPVTEGERVTGAVVVFTDVTDTRRLEEQYRQAQKMEAVGRLAGGVAHDFNNLLTVINGFTHLVLGTLHDPDRCRPLLEEVAKAGERAAALTGQLLAFSRKQVLQPKLIDLNALVAGLGKMLARLLGEDVELSLALAPAVSRVKADPGQVEQVVMNLAVNARDAMPTGGTLTVTTGDVELDRAYAETHAEVRPGRYVRLAVTDTGHGMDPATLARIFEPFFTTKGEGHGTGLGLATVYGIVKQSGGHVEVSSQVGVGTRFEVFLPVAEPEASSESRPTCPAGAPGGRETVLLVEDEEAVRRLSRRLLEAKGYTVLEAGNGADALALAADHPGPIHLLVSDVVMPRMGGRELAERLAALRPGLKVLYLSGYTDDAVVRHGVREGQVPFLQKPFPPDALARTVRAVLDGKV